ncbi:IclR family transcriptional regulator [Pontivivens insulae]|uniref:Transcriptional regulator KdgR n=1 Tax=Pontivivens insulae TaxID=1639689 RepID=A0A2R8AEE4_9RHOB|nr:IclR family transcriptional regulator [Pontivivens insulae]RED14391.1 IclR family transcriptional regulator [Pontivivens insulae]SPF30468.1 Transcriptional regulator KdgR [Pontivivens insulae]
MGVSHSDGTVGKALAVLDVVASFGRPVRFAEVQAASDLPKATLYRLIQTLTNQHMLGFDAQNHTYQPGTRLMRLAHAAWQQASLAPIARPHLDRLSAQLGQTVHLAQLDGAQVLYLDKRNATRPIAMFSDAGKIGPGYCTGVGKAMLAFLPDEKRARLLQQQSYYPHTDATHRNAESLEGELAEIRQNRLSFDREEHEPTIICVAVPILDKTDHPLGAISVTSSTLRHSLDDLAGLAPALTEAATEIAQDASGLLMPSETT